MALNKDASLPLVEIITNPADLTPAYACACAAFGTQAQDAFWDIANPSWSTPSGFAAGVSRMESRFSSTTLDNNGRPSTIYLKATLPDPDDPTHRILAGFAIWVQATAVPGHGDLIPADMASCMDLEDLYPGDEKEQRFLAQMTRSFLKMRGEFVRSKATATPPAVMVLDHCVTDPRFQRRGVASAMVRWGLEEARRRGLRDVATEASIRGRMVYARFGFRAVGEDVVFEVDEEFREREKTRVLFMVYSIDGAVGEE